MQNNTASTGTTGRGRRAKKASKASTESASKAPAAGRGRKASVAPSIDGASKGNKARIAALKKQIATATRIGEGLTKAVRENQSMLDSLTAERKQYEST